MSAPTNSLFEPLRLTEKVSAKNRLAMGPMTINQASPTGHITDWVVDWYRRRAEGGFGTIIGAAVFVSQGGRGWKNAVGIADDSYIDGWKRCVDVAHKHGALFGTQLFHSGAMSTHELLGQQPVSASPWQTREFDTARQLSSDEVEQIIQDFADGARRSVEAGCDFVEIHGAHGYLVHQFWRGDVNHRTDRWGDLTAFPSAVTKAVREAIGPDVPLIYRFSVHADDPSAPNNPVTPKTLEELLTELEIAGVDVWDISCWRDSRRGYFGTEVWLPDYTKRFSSKPRIIAGNIITPVEAREYLAKGHAEGIALARAAIADSHWPEKALRGEDDSIRPVTPTTVSDLSRGISG